MWVQSLDWKDPLEEGMATHSGILAWRIPWTEEPGAGAGVVGSYRLRHNCSDSTSLYASGSVGNWCIPKSFNTVDSVNSLTFIQDFQTV